MNKSLLVMCSLALLVVLILGFFMPLQTDEIAWSYADQRGVQDNFHVMTLMPQCQDAGTFAKPLPLSWYPYAWVNHFIAMQIDPSLWIRIVGMARFLLFLVASWFIIKPLALTVALPPRNLFIIFASFLSLDTMPLLLQVNRPEQTLLLSMAVLLALALNSKNIAATSTVFFRYAASATFVMTVLLCFPAHPKAIALLPLAIACTYLFFRALYKTWWITSAFMLVTAAFALQSAFFWLLRYDCPHSPVTRDIIATHSLPWQTMLSQPAYFISAAVATFIGALFTDFSLDFKIRTTPVWLPFSLSPLANGIDSLDYIIGWIAFALNIILFLMCIRFVARILAKGLMRGSFGALAGFGDKNAPAVENSFGPRLLLACTTIISLVILILITGNIRLFYNMALQIPLLYIGAFLCVCVFPKKAFAHSVRRCGPIAGLLALVSIILLCCRYYPFITQPQQREYLAGRRAILLSPWNYQARKQQVEEAYRACGLPPLSIAKHLILDDFTYPMLKRSYEPFSFHYVTNIFASNNFAPQQLFDEMKRYDSDGIILDCRQVPDTLLPFLTKYNHYCCVPGMHLP